MGLASYNDLDRMVKQAIDSTSSDTTLTSQEQKIKDLRHKAIRGAFSTMGAGMGFRMGSSNTTKLLSGLLKEEDKYKIDKHGNKRKLKKSLGGRLSDYLSEKDPNKRTWTQALSQIALNSAGGLAGAYAGHLLGSGIAAPAYENFTEAIGAPGTKYKDVFKDIFKNTNPADIDHKLKEMERHVNTMYGDTGVTSNTMGNIFGGIVGSYATNKLLSKLDLGYKDYKQGWFRNILLNTPTFLADAAGTSAGIGLGGTLVNALKGVRLSPFPKDYYKAKEFGKGKTTESLAKTLDNYVFTPMLPGRFVTHMQHVEGDPGEDSNVEKAYDLYRRSWIRGINNVRHPMRSLRKLRRWWKGK